MDTDVLVVGAGPAGSATAMLLARRGYRVMIVDKTRFPRPKACGEYLNPTAVTILDRLALRSIIEPLGRSLSGMFLTGGCHSVWVPFDAGRGLLVPRELLDHALVREAVRAGAVLIENFHVDAVTTGVAPSVAGRHQSRPLRLGARIIVGADGMRSMVARRQGAGRQSINGHYAVGARFEDLTADAPRGDLHLGPGWYVGAALYGRGAGRIVVALPRAALRRAHGNVETVFTAACDALPPVRSLTRGSRRVGPFVSAGPLGYMRRTTIDDGVLLVGDAAGVVNPMTGQGLAMALRGAELAADAVDRVLRAGAVDRRALAPYENARTAAFADTWRMSRLLQWIVRQPRVAAPLFARLAGGQDLAARVLGVVSGLRPAEEVLSPQFLIRLLRTNV